MAKFMDKLVPDLHDFKSDGQALPQPILNFIVTNAVPSNNSDQAYNDAIEEAPRDPGRHLGVEDGVYTPVLDTLGSV